MVVVVSLQVICHPAVRTGTVGGIEFTEARSTCIAEIRVESNTGNAGFVGKHGIVEIDVTIPEVQVQGNPGRFTVNQVKQSPQIIDHQATGAVR